jgi:hypothetical protein
METNTENLQRDMKYHRNLAWTNLGGAAVETLAIVAPLKESINPGIMDLAALSVAGLMLAAAKWQKGKQLAAKRQLYGQVGTEEPVPALSISIAAPIPVD